MSRLAFHLSCVPPKTSHHRKGVTSVGKFARMFDKPTLVAAKRTLEMVLLPHQPPSPVRGPVVLALEWTWPWLASDTKRVRALGRVLHETTPDLSNVLKTLEDRMVALGFIEDDKKVVGTVMTKWRGDVPGIGVVIETVDGPLMQEMSAMTRQAVQQ